MSFFRFEKIEGGGCSEKLVATLDVAPLPVRDEVELVPAHPEDSLEVGVGQVALEVQRVDVARKAVVVGLQQVEWVDVRRRGGQGPVVRLRHVR